MANLEQLNFDVLINDKEFNDKITQMKAAADDLNTTLSNLLSIKGNIMPITPQDVESAKNYNKILKDNLKTQLEMERKTHQNDTRKAVDDAAAEARARKEVTKAREQEAREIIKTQMSQERLNRLQRESNSLLGRSSRLWREMGSMVTAYFSIRGATSLVQTLTRVTAEFEMQRVTLGAILNDTQAAGKLFDQIKDLAVRSPFQFKELTSYAKQLSAYSIPVNELYETTKMLADVSAGLGVGMDRLVLAYGQIRSASFLRGQEVRQLTEAGIPILEELRKQFVELGEEGITVGDVFDKISKRMVPFEMVEKVFKNMTSEGGKFFEMQEVQAETLKGKISNLTDAYQIMFSEIGDRKQGLLKGAVDMARSLAENYEKVGRAITALIAAYGAYKIMVAGIHVIETARIMASQTRVSVVSKLAKAIKLLTQETALYKTVMKAIEGINPWAMMGAAVMALVGYMVSANVQAARFKKELNGVAEAQLRTADKSVKGFKDLVEQLRHATEGSQNYRDAISKLNNQYGEYLPNLLNEKNALLEIAKAEQQVTNAIYARARAYAESEGLQKIEEKEGKKVSKATTDLLKALRGKNLAEDVADDFIKGFRDALQNSEESISTVFHDTLKNYLGDEYYQWGEESLRYWNEIIGAANEYGESVRAVADATKDYNRVLDLRFGNQGYSSAQERERIGKIEAEYAKEEMAIRDRRMTDEETEKALLDNKIAKLNAMKDAYVQLNAEAKELGKAGAWNNQIRDIQRQLDALKPADDSWLQKLVNPVAKAGGQRDLIAQTGDQYDEYADKLRKEYKDVTEVLKDAQDTYNGLNEDKKKGLEVDDAVLQKAKEQYDYLQKRQKTIENIGEALHISVNDKIRKTSSGGSSGKSAEQVELEMRRDTLKDLLKWYDKLRDAGMDSVSIKNLLSAYFPEHNDIILAEGYKDALSRVADALEKYDKKAAQALRDDLGLNGIDQQFEQWKRAKKAAEDYEKFMEDWLDESELFGEGSEFNISKAINKYKKTIQDIENKRKEAIEKLYTKANETGIFGLGYLEEGQKIDEKALTQSTNALKVANEEIRKQAEAWVKSWDGIADIDISHMADLTTRELQKLMEALKMLSDNPEQYFSDDLMNGLATVEGGLQTFIAAIQEYVKQLNGQAEEKNWDKVVKKIRLYGKALKIATDSLRDLAETAGWSGVSDLADHIDRAAEAATNFVQNLAEGDPLGATVSAVAYIAEEMVHIATSAMEYRNTMQEIQIQMEALSHSAMLSSGVNSIFGTDNYRALKNAYNLLDVMEDKIASLRDRLGNITAHVDKSKWWQFLMAPTAWFGWYQHFFGSESYTSLLDDLGAELFTETGRVNIEAIEALQDKFDKLSASEKIALEQAIQDAKDFNAALDQIDDVMSDLVGNIADNFADAIVDQWKAAGDAATDYGEILDDLATQYAKMYIRNSILENVFDPQFEEDLKKMTLGMDAAGVMSLFDEKVKELEDYYPFFEDVLSGLSNYFTEDADTKNTLGGGIKSITEDTANLLASYVNAIRADVAAIRQAMVAGNTNTLPSPTLAEYLTQIQANTYNTAQNTANLLARIDSVMTMSDGPAIRVLM